MQSAPKVLHCHHEVFLCLLFLFVYVHIVILVQIFTSYQVFPMQAQCSKLPGLYPVSMLLCLKNFCFLFNIDILELLQPYGFDVGESERGNVLRGLDLGVQGMKVGGQVRPVLEQKLPDYIFETVIVVPYNFQKYISNSSLEVCPSSGSLFQTD